MPMIATGLRFLSAEVRSLHAAAYILAGSAFFSSLLALFRDRLLAHTFGAGETLDIYYAAFRIPDLIFVTTASLVSAYVLIPELSKRSQEQAHTYLDTVLAWFSIIIASVSITAWFFAPLVLPHLFPRFALEGRLPDLIFLTRILLLQPIFLGLSNIFSAITQARFRYALYAVTPLLYNVGIIAGIIFLYPVLGISGLAWGIVVGAFFTVAVQVPSVVADGFFTKKPMVAPIKSLWITVRISVPRALALSMNQFAFLGLIGIAGILQSGSISVFMFAYNLQAVPLSIIGASYSVAAFPKLAHIFSTGDKQAFLAHVSVAARHIFFWSIPAMVLLIVLRAYIVRLVLGSGAFDWTDTRLTAAALALFALSLLAQGLVLLLVRGYYAAGKTLVPFLLSFFSALSAVVLGYLFVQVFTNQAILSEVEALLRVKEVPGSAVLALALAYSLTSIVGAIALAVHFELNFRGFFGSVRRTFVESIVCASIGGLVAYATLFILGGISELSTTIQVFLRGFVAGVFGLLAVALTYHFLGNEEFNEAVAALRRAVPARPILSAEDVAS